MDNKTHWILWTLAIGIIYLISSFVSSSASNYIHSNHTSVLDGFRNDDYYKVFPTQLIKIIGNKVFSSQNGEINTVINKELNSHMSSVSFNLGNLGKHGEIIIDLEINERLISSSFTQTVCSDRYGCVAMPVKIKDINHCNYHGVVRNHDNSNVAVSTCNGIRGYIEFDNLHYIIEPISNDCSAEGHVVYHPANHDSFQPLRDATCGQNETERTNHFDDLENAGVLNHRSKRAAGVNQKYFIELLMVMDKENYNRFKTPEARNEHVIEVVNLVDSYYKKLGFRVVLSHIEFWKDNKVKFTTNARKDLDLFVNYRIKRLKDKSADNPWHRTDASHLLFGRDFQGTTIGMAHIAVMCGKKSASVNQDLGKPFNVASTVAHEMGHNFGMHHDTDECRCAAGTDCIMASSAGFRAKKDWSACSKEYLREGLKLGLGSCLMNVPESETLWGGPKCGNEIIEKGEQCDCGSVADCISKCCNASTCQLLPHAECDDGECCSGCSFKKSGTLCRSTDGNECDLPEFCSGGSAFCPGNVHMEDGSPCQRDTQSCFEGICLTHDLQCKILWGEGARQGDESCYSAVNKQGNENGNCGRDVDGGFVKCSKTNALCGKLNCHSDNTWPILKGLSHRFSYNNRVRGVKDVCKTVQSKEAKSNLEDMDDSGLVQEGTSCGKNMACVDNECLLLQMNNCSEKCNGNGICNNKGHCHCDNYWDPPYCDKKGRGGSFDSNPAMTVRPEETTIELTTSMVSTTKIITIKTTSVSTHEKPNHRGNVKPEKGTTSEHKPKTTTTKPTTSYPTLITTTENSHEDPQVTTVKLKENNDSTTAETKVSKAYIPMDIVLLITLFCVVLPLLLVIGTFLWYRYFGGKAHVKNVRRNRDKRLQQINAISEEKERLAAVAKSKNSSKYDTEVGRNSNFDNTSLSRLIINDVNVSPLHSNMHATVQLHAPPSNMGNTHASLSNTPRASPRASPRPNRRPPAPPNNYHPSPLAQKIPPPRPEKPLNEDPIVKKQPPQLPDKPVVKTSSFGKPMPPRVKPKVVMDNSHLRSQGGSRTPPVPPSSSRKPSPFIGGRKSVSRPTTPAKPHFPSKNQNSSSNKTSFGHPKTTAEDSARGDSPPPYLSSFSALRAKFNE